MAWSGVVWHRVVWQQSVVSSAILTWRGVVCGVAWQYRVSRTSSMSLSASVAWDGMPAWSGMECQPSMEWFGVARREVTAWGGSMLWHPVAACAVWCGVS